MQGTLRRKQGNRKQTRMHIHLQASMVYQFHVMAILQLPAPMSILIAPMSAVLLDIAAVAVAVAALPMLMLMLISVDEVEGRLLDMVLIAESSVEDAIDIVVEPMSIARIVKRTWSESQGMLRYEGCQMVLFM